jgi:hypothetical protein
VACHRFQSGSKLPQSKAYGVLGTRIGSEFVGFDSFPFLSTAVTE